jgi:tape measure domain-containing protein
MNDEVRRLIYELVVEAKGVKEAEEKVNLSTKAMENMTAMAKKAGAALGAAFALKEIAKTLGDIQKVQSQLKTLGLSSTEAAKGMQDIENVAVTTGSTIEEVAEVYQAAIEATQKLGGTQQDAAELANAFTRAAKAQGKSAADAAKQLDTLQFAMDRGTVKVKELSNLMKDNEIFQQAAEKAMGKTTAEIIKMAEAGQVGAQDLGKMLEVMKEMGAATEVPTTLEGITNSLISAGKAFIDATAGAAGLNESLSHGTSGWLEFVNILRLVGSLLGSALSITFNLVETLGQAAIAINVAFVDAITGNFAEAGAALDLFTQQAKENFEDVQRSLAAGQAAFDAVVGNKPAASAPGRLLGDPNALAAQEHEAMLEKGADDFIKAMLKEAEIATKAREKAAKAAIEANQRRIIKEAEDNQHAREFEQQQQEKLNQWLEDSRVEAGEMAAESIRKQWEEPGGLGDSFDDMMDKQTEVALAAADTIAGAFEGIFTGATHNAREFFTEILRGMAQIFAARAASQMSDFLGGVFTGGAKAKGDAFEHGSVIPFAAGGVVGGPTVFAMAGGRMGLMGEAGEEAIMPLRRGANGKLGVTGTVPRVEIHNNLGVEANARVDASGDRMRIVLEAAQLGASMAESRVNRSLRSGYGATAQSVQRTYGLRRRF